VSSRAGYEAGEGGEARAAHGPGLRAYPARGPGAPAGGPLTARAGARVRPDGREGGAGATVRPLVLRRVSQPEV
jgi:hypothetical protein